MEKTIYYHGTDRVGINGMLTSRVVGFEYFDGYGFYVTKSIDDALNHGQYVLVIENIDESKLTTDETNDGFFYNGKLDLEFINNVLFDIKDRRVLNDLAIQNLDIQPIEQTK